VTGVLPTLLTSVLDRETDSGRRSRWYAVEGEAFAIVISQQSPGWVGVRLHTPSCAMPRGVMAGITRRRTDAARPAEHRA